MKKIPKVYLIRHGETAWSLSGQQTGFTDLELTDNGREQVLQMKELLAGKHFDQVFCSPLKRAMETCKLTGYFDHAILDPDLVEWDYGDYEGMTHAEIVKKDPGWSVFTCGAPGGESVEDVGLRADRVLQKVRALGGDIALFSSGHILRAIAARWIDLPVTNGQHFLLSTASISILSFERETPAIMLWNLNSQIRMV